MHEKKVYGLAGLY